MVNPFFMKGKGIDRVMFELGKRLKKWFDIEVLCAKADYYDQFVNTKIIPSRKIFGYEAIDMYFKIGRHLKNYDVINPHHEILNLPCLFSKKPVITTYHGFQRVWGGNIVRRCIRSAVLESHALFYRYNTHIITISKYLANELVQRYHIPKEKITIVHNGVDFEKFKLGKDKGYMLFVGRHERYKGVHELLQVVKETNFPLVTVGTGREIENLKLEAHRLGVSDKIKFMGNVGEKTLSKLYSNCSFFISASKWEGFGLIFLEAAASKKPSIAYNICSIPEIIIHNKTGFLANNLEEMIKYCKILINNQNLRKKIGREAYHFVKKNFSWDYAAKRYKEIFENFQKI